jgi:hypothetical protein
MDFNLCSSTGKDKVNRRTGNESPENECRYSITRSLTSAIDEGDWSTSRSGRFTAKKRVFVPILEEAGWAPVPVWTGVENLAPTWIRPPDRPGP